MNVYVAGKYTAKERLKGERERMRAMGFKVDSLWMDQPEEGYTFNGRTEGERWKRAYDEARRDVENLQFVDAMVIDTQDESTTGGREVELGIALSRGIKVVVIGPVRNIFHHLAHARYESWDEFFAAEEAHRGPLPRPRKN